MNIQPKITAIFEKAIAREQAFQEIARTKNNFDILLIAKGREQLIYSLLEEIGKL